MNLSHIGFSQIELLVALVDTGSFSQAASDIGVSQSAVSHGLARLETELGVTLVERGRRGISLTEAGREVLGHAREVLRRLDAIRQAAAAASLLASFVLALRRLFSRSLRRGS
ncbi:MAG: LysR family transcriptional regulator [Cytophagales bacterium]|nr:LysR family transcriptional regulator [Armatimonadota bacterium]